MLLDRPKERSMRSDLSTAIGSAEWIEFFEAGTTSSTSIKKTITPNVWRRTTKGLNRLYSNKELTGALAWM